MHSRARLCGWLQEVLHCLQAVVSYTAEQIKDLMHLRQLFYSKVGQLCRERKALLRRMANEQEVGASIGLDEVSVRLAEVSDLADQLRANGADEYRTYMQFSSAFSRGVRPFTCSLSRAYCSHTSYLDPF